MSTEYTIPDTTFGKRAIGYTLNSGLSPFNTKVIGHIQKSLQDRFGDAIMPMPPETLHITLCDWVAPLVDYGENKDAIFKRKFLEYDQAMSEMVREVGGPITIHFSELRASQGALFVVGYDNGEFARIRGGFLKKAELLPGTKQPPAIIHCTVARYAKAVELRPLVEFAASVDVKLDQQVDAFRLNREVVIPMLEFETLKEYKLR